ncbi:MAG: glycine--tRNA ligase subunit beta [bacterium]|nr:glycine--tRNA ligase subunit beta [bacterium]
MTNDKTASLPFLLEIGSEEIPARFIPGAMAELEKRFATALAEARLEASGLRVLGAPRRMALLIDAVATAQPSRETVVKGPPVSVAFDAAGAPTKAGEGFARKVGLDLAACERAEGDRGEYLLARRTEEGRPAADVLAEIVPAVIRALPFRKVMRWADHELEYPRPLQWLVALLGGDVVPARLEYMEAGRTSRGHRTLAGDRPVEITGPADYVESLRDAGVVVDHRERERVVTEGLTAAVAAWNAEAELRPDPDLVSEVVHLCEHPTPFLGSYDEVYAELPDRVVATALKAHQRYFSVGRPGGRLLPRFAAVRDGGSDHLDTVVRGNERVLRARLADALFYWNFDQQRLPDERVEQLATVTWFEGFGSVLDKTRRLEILVGELWRRGLGGGTEMPAALPRAAVLCKSDLVSEMIRDGKEFTKLEGFIGARYAERAGEPVEVCRAIEDHFAPRTATGRLPGDAVSAALAVADRLDNLAGCWLAGFVPTGAKDPYALRRQILAVVRILLDRELRLDLEEALAVALDPLRSYAPDRDAAEVLAELGGFVRGRLARHFTEVLGADADVVRAVLPVRWADPVDAKAWIGALSGYRDRTDFQQLATGFKRCRNILEGEVLGMAELDACRTRWLDGGAGAGGEDLAGLPESAEQELFKQVAAAAVQVAEAEKSGDYEGVFDHLSSLGPSIDGFFETVRVNVDEVDLKVRRRAFLREIHGLFAIYADFTAVAPTEE